MTFLLWAAQHRRSYIRLNRQTHMYNMRQTHLLKMRTKRSSAAHLPERRRTDNAQKNKPYFAARLSNRRRIETPFWRLVSHTRTKRNLTRRLPARTTTKRKSPSDSQPLPNRTPPHRCAITPQQRNEHHYITGQIGRNGNEQSILFTFVPVLLPSSPEQSIPAIPRLRIERRWTEIGVYCTNCSIDILHQMYTCTHTMCHVCQGQRRTYLSYI